MTRYLVGFVCLLAPGVMGCSETAGTGGSGGMGGSGGTLECQSPEDCNDFSDCTSSSCDSQSGMCNESTPLTDGTPCAGGTCQAGECVLTGSILPCTEQGIRNAIAAGDGPFTFDCDGPTTVVTEAEIVIDNDVILDGENDLTVDGSEDHRVLEVADGVAAELHRLTIARGVTIAAPDSLDGSGILNRGNLTLVDSIIRDNEAKLSNECGRDPCFPNAGGIVNLGSLMLANSVVSGNIGAFGGGITNFGALTMNDSRVSQNVGTGVYNLRDAELTMTNSTASENAGSGVENSGRFESMSSTVSGNGSTGIRNQGPNASIQMTNSTVSGNISRGEAGGISNSDGAELTLENCTVSGNAAQTFAGGGIYASAFGSLRIVSSTVSGNTAPMGSALYKSSINPVTFTNSLIDGDCAGQSGTNSDGYNIESPGDTCGFDADKGDLFNVTTEQLNLGPLQDNGGPTMTHALRPGGVAIDVIPVDACAVDTDQRGVSRPQGDACDMGAFELEVAP